MPARHCRLLSILSCACAAITEAAAPQVEPAASHEMGRERLEFVRSEVFQYTPTEKPAADARSLRSGQPEAFVGREDLYIARVQAAYSACVPLEADPIRLIAERADKTNIVIINEHHSSPRDRHFIAQVLVALRPAGYSVYAAETLSQIDRLDEPDALGSHGWYTNEPIFGRTLRLARSLGYALVAYEQTPEQQSAGAQLPASARSNLRERDQAGNLMAAIFSKNPDTKVVIHVGHGHVNERQRAQGPGGFEAMAQRLKVATGRDPLTISQTTCRAPGTEAVVADFARKPDGGIEAESQVDLLIGHPPLQFENGRPTWRTAAGDKPVAMPTPFRNHSERVIVEARPEHAGRGVVPVDRVLLYTGEQLPLLLPAGRYRVDGFTVKGRIEEPPVVLEVR